MKGNTQSCPLAGPPLVVQAVLAVVVEVVVVVVVEVVVVVDVVEVVIVVVVVPADVVVEAVVVVVVVVVEVVAVVPVEGQDEGQKPYWPSWNSPAVSTEVAHQGWAWPSVVQVVKTTPL